MKYLLLLVLLWCSSVHAEEKYCSYTKYFMTGPVGPTVSGKEIVKQIQAESLEGCQKDDVITITTIALEPYESVSKEERIQKDIAELCDFNRQVIVISPDRAVCIYRGDRKAMHEKE